MFEASPLLIFLEINALARWTVYVPDARTHVFDAEVADYFIWLTFHFGRIGVPRMSRETGNCVVEPYIKAGEFASPLAVRTCWQRANAPPRMADPYIGAPPCCAYPSLVIVASMDTAVVTLAAAWVRWRLAETQPHRVRCLLSA